ncbi:hypothetical protein PT160_07730 [Erysipelothrix rhusiopathiae]|nr:hypothetical protein [Erysipelothrix rhusiopathiae]MDE8269054.1 hypothetical protein [Erysipelothrix rhusiopathiae]MDE8270677.1 hypothetical protein [Erysipelothrix rhusiopathiae]MDE8279102.1 hypothetical protein [Erysipelothrix rhusiopathiae]MDE8319412.1 hypothetical protein [Erysipelothrix rhusiopathiae]
MKNIEEFFSEKFSADYLKKNLKKIILITLFCFIFKFKIRVYMPSNIDSMIVNATSTLDSENLLLISGILTVCYFISLILELINAKNISISLLGDEKRFTGNNIRTIVKTGYLLIFWYMMIFYIYFGNVIVARSYFMDSKLIDLFRLEYLGFVSLILVTGGYILIRVFNLVLVEKKHFNIDFRRADKLYSEILHTNIGEEEYKKIVKVQAKLDVLERLNRLEREATFEDSTTMNFLRAKDTFMEQVDLDIYADDHSLFRDPFKDEEDMSKYSMTDMDD